MDITQIAPNFSVSDQISPYDLYRIKLQGFKTVLCLSHDKQETNQPKFSEIAEAANCEGLLAAYLPVASDEMTPRDIKVFNKVYANSPKPILAFGESNNCAVMLWTLIHTPQKSIPTILTNIKSEFLKANIREENKTSNQISPENFHQVVIIGGGTAGIAVANNLMLHNSNLDIALIDPADMHYYQSAWTMVGGGIFSEKSTARKMESVVPTGVKLIKSEVKSLNPSLNQILLNENKIIRYEILIICPGIKLNWNAIDGLTDTLGKNGVTSNYRYDLAPYTWHLVHTLNKGSAVFTQPRLPIKCTYAPQKAIYLSADYWLRENRISNISLDFYNAGATLSGISDKTSTLKNSVSKYNIKFHLNHELISVDGITKHAWFSVTDQSGNISTLKQKFDLLHVVPPQQTPDFIHSSSLADKNGWLEVNAKTLKHVVYENIYGLGDVINLPNAKTASAARTQAKVVASNILFDLKRLMQQVFYDGYGSRPLTTKHGEIDFAEYGYADKCYLDFLSDSAA